MDKKPKHLWQTRKWIRHERQLSGRPPIGDDSFINIQYSKTPDGVKNIKDFAHEHANQIRDEITSPPHPTEMNHQAMEERVSRLLLNMLGCSQTHLQAITNELWAANAGCFQLNPEKPPTIVMKYMPVSNHTAWVAAELPDYIFINLRGILNIVHNPRPIIAHEIAHLLNHDTSIEYMIDKRQKPLNESTEILADRLGAIVLGNARAYSEFFRNQSTENLDQPYHLPDNAKQFYASLSDIQKEAFDRLAKHDNPQVPSNLRQFRMMEKWADILEDNGAANPITGDIIDKDKAITLYRRSHEMTSNLGRLDSDIEWAKAVKVRQRANWPFTP